MKKFKILLCLALVFAMIASTCVVSFASSVSHISYNETTSDEGVTTVESSVYVAGQSKAIKLYTALYDAEGNFVSATASNAATTGLLKTSVTKGEGQTVKSFLWDADNSPKYLPAEIEELSAEDMSNIKITINGNPVSEYGIESLELGGEYYVDILENNLDTIPYVEVESKVATLTASVAVDEENLQTVVTIAKGANGQETVTKTIGTSGSYDVQRYSRASSTITFNWVKNYITDDDFIAATSSTTNGWRYDVPTTVSQRTSKTVTLAERETVKKVSVKFAAFTTQQVIVVVKPASTAAANYIADPKSIVVASDGTALTWTNDTNMVRDYNDVSEGYMASNVTWGQKSSTDPANVAGTNVAAYWPVQDVVTDSDTGYETGSRTTTGRSPNTHQRQVYNLGNNRDLAGNAYIVGPASSYTDAVVTFYIADDAEIVTISPATTVTYSIADGAYEAADASSTANPVIIIYTNNASASDVAWLMKKGYITENDISQTNVNSNKDHVLNDGTTVNPNSYTLRTWNYIFENRVVPSLGYALCEEWAKKKNYTYQEILDLWKDYDFEAGDSALVQDFNASTAFSGTATFRYPENTADYNNEKYADTRKEYVDYSYSVSIVANNRASLEKGGFQDSLTIYSDRDGEKNTSGTGTIVSWPEALGLENDYYILPALNMINGNRFGGVGVSYAGNIDNLTAADIWRQDQGVEWASFTVARDAKVTVVSDQRTLTFTSDQDGWNYADLGTTDCISALTTLSNGNKRNFRYIYTKFYPAGSKVILTSPGSAALYVAFVDEWDSGIERSAKLTGIAVDGANLSGFDADTTEYTYTVAANASVHPVISATAEDASAKVKVIYPTEFPGSAKIKVSNLDVEKTYTINFAVDSSLGSNLVMSPSVTFTAGTTATLNSNLQVGDSCYTDRLTNTAMKFSAIASKYIGKDWIRGALGWQTDSASNDYKAKWISTDIISDWVSFDIHRDATIYLICGVSNANAKGAYLTGNGWIYGYDANGYMVGYTSQDVSYQHEYTKHFEVDAATGKATVQLPNIGGNSMFAVIVYDDWNE